MDPANEPVVEQTVAPPAEKPGVYTGPERRAQGYLVAELIPEAPKVDRQAPEFHPPR